MLVRNLGRWTCLTIIGGFFNFLGILFIGALNGVLGYVASTNFTYFSAKITSPILTTLVSILF
jgi:hypothetical protein